MLVSRQLRETNIVEYLLYMWQVEDLIRSSEFNAERIVELVIASEEYDDVIKNEWTEWYRNLIDMMINEGVTERGHLMINRSTMVILSDFHRELMESAEEKEYHALFLEVLPFIAEYRSKNNRTGEEIIEECLELIYGIWMLRLQKRPISDETDKAVKKVSDFLASLTAKYKKKR
ncbi:MAG TPA: DUF4924 family protein [Bacteroidaceae bacterium]|nr:DUF4924 family protein [Bacteroidaceae bacterium]